ncbi:beta-lactamase family protein [Pontibacter ummariensis]|uniref:Beta-lactamase enzyme family protein n=2 Tax=Pontibacter ummariensis TaxID=1610492 RepID=A0A239E699_9BACT|nr:beta-lactamase family protein [Pontibacter ummariensis]SNS39808.1 Beta-lactamase enzyme family protein [Pontibacter ummariensis]
MIMHHSSSCQEQGALLSKFIILYIREPLSTDVYMKLPLLLAACCLIGSAFATVNAQTKGDRWLEDLLRSQGSPLLQQVLNQPDTFQYQIIYTEINRDKHNRPHFKHHYFNVDRNRYHNPASTVKLPTALMALEKLNTLQLKGVDKFTAMLTDSAFSKQTAVVSDSTAENGLPSIAHYIKKVFLVSDNDAYNRLYEWVGQQTLNEGLWQKGYKDVRITRRFTPMSEEENRWTNPVRFMQQDKVLYAQAAVRSNANFDFSKTIHVGKAHYNWDDELIHEPIDFTTHNQLPLQDLQQLLQSVMFPESVPAKKRFNLSHEDYTFLYEYMAKLPFESDYPSYDTNEFFDSYTKFFMFRADKSKIPDYMRVFNKTGWSYGFLTDASYVVDFKNKVEYMLSAVIYVNSDGVLNDNKYEYEEVGYPFFKEVGQIIYDHELKRERKYSPDLSKFKQ